MKLFTYKPDKLYNLIMKKELMNNENKKLSLFLFLYQFFKEKINVHRKSNEVS